MNGKTVITSSNNPQIKNLALLQKKAKARDEQGLFVVEGIKMFEEARSEGLLVKAYMSESFYIRKEKTPEFFDGLSYEIVSDTLFNQITDTKTPQGILGTVKKPIYSFEDLLKVKDAFLLILEDIRDPGNLGTIIRTAEGAGVTGIVLNRSCADILQPKVVRSTMGSIFRVPYYEAEDFLAFLDNLKTMGFTLYAAHLSGNLYDTEGSFRGKIGLLIGNEANGLSDEASRKADKLIKIPMAGKVESLNAAIAAAILMYEAARQRRKNSD
ncbi:MAG TPA: 23S rRNA (guanosine(2251)-2'-O)-methyltransferase RlmB [Mobilitalea sp.]|nr:23S rRNA (guanosine(2251)-2'-O)-methyltransferase RlmB [Mobilitalea sp.]